MRFSVISELSRKQSPGSTRIIYIRITFPGVHKTISTPYKINPKHWDKRRVKSWHKSAGSINPELDRLENLISGYIVKRTNQGIPVSIEDAIAFTRNLVSGNTPSNVLFLRYTDIVASRIDAFNTRKSYKGSIEKLRRYIKEQTSKDDISFYEINYGFLCDYERYLKSEVGNCQNTVNSDMKRIRTTFNKAIKEEIIPYSVYPFRKYSFKKAVVRKDVLTYQELKNIENVPLKEGSLIDLCRDIFVFQFYCAGIRISDALLLTKNNVFDNKVLYYIQKTGERMNVILPENALRIVEKYADSSSYFLFPMLTTINSVEISNKTALINKYLKKIATAAEINKRLTTHVSRHTFATYAWNKTGNVRKVKEALKHSNVKITEGYLAELNIDDLDNIIGEIFD